MPFRQSRRLGPTVEGRRPVLEALRAGQKLRRLLLIEDVEQGPQIAEILERARAAGIPIETVSRRELDRLAATHRHQGVLAVAPNPEYVILEDLVEESLSGERPALLAVLDGIEDPQNLGAIIRTVDGAGGNGVIIPERRAVGITAGVRRAAAGATEHVPVARVVNLSRTLEFLKSAGFWVVGLDAAASRTYTHADFSRHVAIVVGSEGKGLSRLVREHCDELVSIPLLGELESLNASVSAGIVLYEVVRQRRSTPRA